MTQIVREDKILEVFEMPEEDRWKMGIRGKEWVIENRTFEKFAKKYLETMSNA